MTNINFILNPGFSARDENHLHTKINQRVCNNIYKGYTKHRNNLDNDMYM
jgi:hypothetical protein